MTLEILKDLLTSGEFHHATYRNHCTLWEGLWIYRKDANGFQGYVPAGAFFKDSNDLDAAHALVRKTGISLGAYGQG
jgi:hypothetical protein